MAGNPPFFYEASIFDQNMCNEISAKDSELNYCLWCFKNLDFIGSSESISSSGQSSFQSHTTFYEVLMGRHPSILKRSYQHSNKEAKKIVTDIIPAILNIPSINWHHFIQIHMRLLKKLLSLKNKLAGSVDPARKVAEHFKFDLAEHEELIGNVEVLISLLQEIDLPELFQGITRNQIANMKIVQRLFRAPKINDLFRAMIKLAKVEVLRNRTDDLRRIFENNEALVHYERFLEIFYLPQD